MAMKRTTILFLLLVFPLSAIAGSGPRITFDKLTHDYGKVKYGTKVTEEFSFTNTGDETLKIEDLRSTCGCTKAVKGSTEIPPKGQSKIIAEFDTTDLRPGRKKKIIFVHSNDPEQPIVKLTLLAEVLRELTVSPPSLAKKLPGFTSSVKFPLRISNSSDRECAITGVTVNGPLTRAQLEPEKIVIGPQSTGSGSVELKLEKQASRHYYMGRLMLLTDHPTEKEIELRYFIQLDQPR